MIKIILRPWFTLALILSFSGLSSFAASAGPVTSIPQSVEEIFNIFDSGQVQDPKSMQAMLDYLKQNITIEDEQNYLKVQPILCWNQFDISQSQGIDEAIAFANQQIAAPQVPNSAEATLDLKLCRAYMMQLKGEVDAALKEYNVLVNQAYTIESPKLIADIHSLRGAIYSFQGNFILALKDLIAAQKLYEELKLEYWSLQNLTELATSYRRMGDPQTAITYYKKLEAQFTKLNYADSANLMNVQIAYALEELGENEQALKYHLISHKYWQTHSHKTDAAYSAVNIAGTLIQLGRIAEADHYLAQAEQVITADADEIYSFMRLYQAQSVLEKLDFQTTQKYLDEAKNSFISINNLRGLEMLYQVKSQASAIQQDWQQAYQAQQDYIETHKVLDKSRQSVNAAQMRTRYDTERIERENQQLLELQKVKENELVISNQNRILQLTVIILSCIIMFFLAIIAYKQAQKSKSLSILASTDHLTQLPNRRSTYHKGEQYFVSTDAEDQPLSLILFDIDHFKQVNDKYGHDIGDIALIEIAKVSNSMMRKQDLVGRVGGEEFLAILPGTNAEQAMNIAQRLVNTIYEKNFDNVAADFKLAISAGVATKAEDNKFAELLKRADEALYQVKTSGRNAAKLSEKNRI
ncbi:diguanylate cyclase [Shewanella sp. Isolate11]|uniref:GGDEF domain-containing protein n=1 Tax=Shewanella sp. Isolate11 TaxID=2908530 RepID=UPI001EFD2C1A|nr:diguanylate cyclase [Shewanella sp. Isolate11]MCG9697735.1 diguanylate cyclase [Shewanella sp. Isolate11]